MSRKRKKRKKKVLSLPVGTTRESKWNSCLNLKRVNQLWRWDTLVDVDEFGKVKF